MLQRRGGKGVSSGPVETEVSFIREGVEDTYRMVSELTEEWRKEEKTPRPKGIFIFGGGSQPSAFKVVQEIDPRLLKLTSRVEGQVSFELTEVEGGGTSLKTTFSPQARSRVQTLKAQLPLKVLGMKACVSCERMLLPDFAHCPYCGQSQEATA